MLLRLWPLLRTWRLWVVCSTWPCIWQTSCWPTRYALLPGVCLVLCSSSGIDVLLLVCHVCAAKTPSLHVCQLYTSLMLLRAETVFHAELLLPAQFAAAAFADRLHCKPKANTAASPSCSFVLDWPLQTGRSWNAVMHAKAHGARNLDSATRGIKSLQHFVMWSSIVAAAGNEGAHQELTLYHLHLKLTMVNLTHAGCTLCLQLSLADVQTRVQMLSCNWRLRTCNPANNALMSCRPDELWLCHACLDALAEERTARGLPALSVQWGVIDGVGVADKSIQVESLHIATRMLSSSQEPLLGSSLLALHLSHITATSCLCHILPLPSSW